MHTHSPLHAHAHVALIAQRTHEAAKVGNATHTPVSHPAVLRTPPWSRPLAAVGTFKESPACLRARPHCLAYAHGPHSVGSHSLDSFITSLTLPHLAPARSAPFCMSSTHGPHIARLRSAPEPAPTCVARFASRASGLCVCACVRVRARACVGMWTCGEHGGMAGANAGGPAAHALAATSTPHAPRPHSP